MLTNFIVGLEIAQLGDIEKANISILISEENGLLIDEDYIKSGGVVLINKHSKNLPKYIHNIIHNNIDKFTNLSGYLPQATIQNTVGDFIYDIQDWFEHFEVEGKKFVKFKNKELEKIFIDTSLTKSLIRTTEVEELTRDKLIKGCIKINKHNYLAWY